MTNSQKLIRKCNVKFNVAFAASHPSVLLFEFITNFIFAIRKSSRNVKRLDWLHWPLIRDSVDVSPPIDQRCQSDIDWNRRHYVGRDWASFESKRDWRRKNGQNCRVKERRRFLPCLKTSCACCNVIAYIWFIGWCQCYITYILK